MTAHGLHRECDQRAAELAEAEAALATARERAAALAGEAEAMVRVRAQLDLDQQRIMKALVAGIAFAPFEFVASPRCLQSLDKAHREPSDCRLCGQTEPASIEDVSLDGERARLEAQAGETDALIARNRTEMRANQREIELLHERVIAQRRKLDDQIRDASPPSWTACPS